ncbi:MAG: hypothetical protein NVS2B14_20430 [Chamaesiphon sp.]
MAISDFGDLFKSEEVAKKVREFFESIDEKLDAPEGDQSHLNEDIESDINHAHYSDQDLHDMPPKTIGELISRHNGKYVYSETEPPVFVDFRNRIYRLTNAELYVEKCFFDKSRSETYAAVIGYSANCHLGSTLDRLKTNYCRLEEPIRIGFTSSVKLDFDRSDLGCLIESLAIASFVPHRSSIDQQQVTELKDRLLSAIATLRV